MKGPDGKSRRIRRRVYIMGWILLLLLWVPVVTWISVKGARQFTVGTDDPFNLRGDAYWKLRYLQLQWPLADASPGLVQNTIHPTRGWTPKPNFRHVGATLESTNSRGQRSILEFHPRPEKYTVLVFGDSFTFGVDVADSAVWPTLLQGLDTRLNVANMGAPGYGTDQMLITLEETFSEYKPQLIILAPISDDLHRAMLSFREYRKPKFVIGKDDTLILTNTPIGSTQNTLYRLYGDYGFFHPKKTLAEEDTAFQHTVISGQYDRDWPRLNRLIVQRAEHEAQQGGAELLVVHLGSCLEIASPLPEGGAWIDPINEQNVMADAAAQCGAPFLGTVEAFRKNPGPWTSGHYGERETRFVAGLVYDKIQQLASWKKFTGN